MTWVWVAATSHGVLSKHIRKACGRGNTQCSHTWRKVDSLDMRRKDKVQLRGLEGNKYTSPHRFAPVKVIYVIMNMNRCANCCCMEEDKWKKKKKEKMGKEGFNQWKYLVFWYIVTWVFIILSNIEYFVEGGISVLLLGSLKVYNVSKWKFSKQTTSLYVLIQSQISNWFFWLRPRSYLLFKIRWHMLSTNADKTCKKTQ